MKKILLGIFILLVAISMVAGSLVGCGTKTSSTTATTASTTAPLKEATITIGVDTPLTGPAAPWGLGVMHGVTLAFDDANAAGGLTIGNTHYTFTVEALDDKYDTATTTNNIREMINSGTKFIFTFQTEGTLALNETLSQNKVLSFTVVNDDSVISQPYTFRAADPIALQSDGYWQWIAQNHPGAKTVIILTTNNTNGEILEAATKTGCQANNLTYLDGILYDAGTTDFTPYVTKIVAEKPDIINLTGTPTGDCADIIKTLYGMGYKGLICTGTVAAADMLSIAGQDALEGVIDTQLSMQPPYVTSTVLALPDREVAKWGAAYGLTWDLYSQATIMFEAMQRANSVDPTVVKNMLQDSTQKWPFAAITGGVSAFDTPVAQALFGANATNQIFSPWPICVIHNGQDVVATIIQPPGATTK